MRKKYLNLTGNKMNLQIERYLTIPVSVGIGLYEEKIANKFSSIFKPIEEKVVEELEVTEIEEEYRIPIVNEPINIDPEIVEEKEKLVEELEVKEVNYARMTYQELKAIVRKRKIIIDGRKTSRKMIDALESADEK